MIKKNSIISQRDFVTDNKMNRIIMLSFLLLSAIVAFADKKMTISNADNGESIEVIVPDGLRIYEYNSNWLDSIPYLMEHARRGEPWAYEALAECHRYGKGGVKRSLINALFYYDLAGKNVEECITEIGQADHNDPIALFSRLIGYIESRDSERIVCAVDSLNEAGYHSADILPKVIDSSIQIGIEDILKFATDKETDPDASVLACVGYSLYNKRDSAGSDISWAKPLLMEKIPYMYSSIGVKKYEKTIRPQSADGYDGDASVQGIEERRKAVEYLLKADEYGVLTRQAARSLYQYCTGDASSGWVKLSEEDLYRIQQIAEISE